MTTRAVSNPVGVILILGMTILSVGALLAAGGAVIDDTRADAERSQMENSMSAFSSKASLVGLGESGHQRFSLGRVSQGQVDVREDAGRVHVKIQRNGTNETIRETSIGAVVYENDGREIAYQGGGVWARQDDFSRMLSPPEFHYRAETLTFPIINVTGSGAASGDIRGTIRSDTGAQQWYPNDSEEDFGNPLTNGTVYVEIESEYCRGWQSFFESRTQGDVEQECQEGSEETVVVDLTVSLDPTFGTAVTATRITDDGATIDSTRSGVTAPSASDLIDDLIDGCLADETSCEDISGSSIDGGGTYYTEDASAFANLSINTGGSDVDIVINDTDSGLDGTGTIDISGGGTVSVYVKTAGDISMTGGDSVNSGGEPEDLVTYVHSDVSTIKMNGDKTEYVGGIYAPNTDFEGDQGKGNGSGCGGGNAGVTGALVVEDFCFKTGDFNHDSDMNSIDVDVGADTVKYLHVSENDVEVSL